MGAKIFKTIDEQIEILKNKGLTIQDVDFTKDVLLRENYFFVSGYRSLFMQSNDKRFVPGTTFRELYAMFNYDRQMRNIIFKNLLIIENNLKSIMSYQLSKKYGIKESNYLNPLNFTTNPEKIRQVNDLIKKMKRQIRVNGTQNSATSHYMNNYGYIPLWIVVKVLSFGIVTELYTILKKEDQEEIARMFNIDSELLLSYLPILANYRNLCAHEDILFNHKTQKAIDDTRYHLLLRIPKVEGEYIYGKNDLFALVIILKQILRTDNFNLLINELEYEIEILDGKVAIIPLSKILQEMGFPTNYKEIERI